MGFSFVSGVEIIYFFTERFIEALKKKKEKQKESVGVAIIRISSMDPIIKGKLDAKKLNSLPGAHRIYKRENWN